VPREGDAGASGTPQALGDRAPDRGPDVVIVGFGPAGQRVLAQLPQRRRASVAVIDSNPALVAQARQAGAHAHLGDARRTDVLEHAGVRGARVVALTTADVDVVGHVASLVRHLAPTAMIVARSRYRDTAGDIARQGAHRVVDEESLVGTRLASAVEAALRGPRGG
jgi:CPA2 family monovalent cation:H+ antiporter-2